MADSEDTTKKIEKLTSHNYRQWSRLIQLHLKGEGLWSIVDGSEAPPTEADPDPMWDIPLPPEVSDDEAAPDDETNDQLQQRVITNHRKSIRRRERAAIAVAHTTKPSTQQKKAFQEKFAKWEKKDSKCQSIIYMNVDRSIRGDIEKVKTAKEMWTTLENIYASASWNTQRHSYTYMESLRYHIGDDVDKFFAKLQDAFLDAEETGNVISDDLKNGVIVDAMPSVMKNWLEGYCGSMPKNQKVAITIRDIKAKIRLMALSADSEDEAEPQAHYAATRGRSTYKGKANNKDIICHKCGKKGHKAFECRSKRKEDKDTGSLSDEERKLKEQQRRVQKLKNEAKAKSPSRDKKRRSASRSPSPVTVRRCSTATDTIKKSKRAHLAWIESDSVHSDEEESHHSLEDANLDDVNDVTDDSSSEEETGLELHSSCSDLPTAAVFHTGPDKFVKGSVRWLGDSGTTDHMCANQTYFVNLSNTPNTWVTVGNGQRVPVLGIGDCIFHALKPNGDYRRIVLPDVLYVPHLRANLISISAFAEAGYTCKFEAKGNDDGPLKASIVDTTNDKTLFTMTNKHGLYHLDLAYPKHDASYMAITIEDGPDTLPLASTNLVSDTDSSSRRRRPNRPNARRRRKAIALAATALITRKKSRKSRKERHSYRYKRQRTSSRGYSGTSSSSVTSESSLDSNPEFFHYDSDASVSSSQLSYISQTESDTMSSDESPNRWIASDDHDEHAGTVFLASARVKHSKARKRSAPIKARPLAKLTCDHEDHEDTSLYETLMHHRLGHPHHNMLKTIGYHPSLKLKRSQNLRKPTIKHHCCRSCVEGRGTRIRTRRDAARRATTTLELIHSDTCGPITPVSTKGYRYFVVFVDDKTRYCSVAFARKKTEIPDLVKSYVQTVENQTGLFVKIFKTDNGTEFCNSQVDGFCDSKGIFHELSAPYTSRQTGVAERFLRTLVSKAKCLMFTAGAPPNFWDLAVSMAAYIINRLPSEANPHRLSPYEMWNDQIPDLDLIRVWGCTAYAVIDKQRRKGKFAKNALRCIFIGIDGDGSNYLLYNPKTKRVFAASDVVFDEADYSAMESLSKVSANGIGIQGKLLPADLKCLR